jgi:hypothetical protein
VNGETSRIVDSGKSTFNWTRQPTATDCIGQKLHTKLLENKNIHLQNVNTRNTLFSCMSTADSLRVIITSSSRFNIMQIVELSIT